MTTICQGSSGLLLIAYPDDTDLDYYDTDDGNAWRIS